MTQDAFSSSRIIGLNFCLLIYLDQRFLSLVIRVVVTFIHHKLQYLAMIVTSITSFFQVVIMTRLNCLTFSTQTKVRVWLGSLGEYSFYDNNVNVSSIDGQITIFATIMNSLYLDAKRVLTQSFPLSLVFTTRKGNFWR